jgi:hypothetical protein
MHNTPLQQFAPYRIMGGLYAKYYEKSPPCNVQSYSGKLTPKHTIPVPMTLPLPGGLPALITAAGERTAWRFIEFFTATIFQPDARAT